MRDATLRSLAALRYDSNTKKQPLQPPARGIKEGAKLLQPLRNTECCPQISPPVQSSPKAKHFAPPSLVNWASGLILIRLGWKEIQQIQVDLGSVGRIRHARSGWVHSQTRTTTLPPCLMILGCYGSSGSSSSILASTRGTDARSR